MSNDTLAPPTQKMSPEQWQNADALGRSLAARLEWNTDHIVAACAAALEDANSKDEAELMFIFGALPDYLCRAYRLISGNYVERVLDSAEAWSRQRKLRETMSEPKIMVYIYANEEDRENDTNPIITYQQFWRGGKE